MKYLGIEDSLLEKYGALNTAREISQQPLLWKEILRKVSDESAALDSFLSSVLPTVQRIILTGAGSSAYIGLSVKGTVQRKTGKVTEAIPTTDLVSHPGDFFIRHVPTLMVSFARSGNSPESVAAVELADRLTDNCRHLFITCDPNGRLAKYKTKLPGHTFFLPDPANDRSLAMTGSYSGMLLAALLILAHGDAVSDSETVERLCSYGWKVLTSDLELLKEIAGQDFHRAVFLGSGPLSGTATESQLKLQELTDGRIICKRDSFLGYRHGPKAVTDQKTLMVYLFSNDRYVHLYEQDLVESMKTGKKALLEIGVSEKRLDDVRLRELIWFSDDAGYLAEEYLPVCSILPGQLLGFFKSLQLGLSPDNPSRSGAISRVVNGVNIYQL
jgi:tagatose-6-phosphate ketose/aldose isomerase